MTLGVVVDPVLKRLLFPKRIRNKNKNPNIITEIDGYNKTENTSTRHTPRKEICAPSTAFMYKVKIKDAFEAVQLTGHGISMPP